MFASGPGQSHTFSVFVGPVGTDMGVSMTAVASAYGFATLVAAFCLPLMGKLIDHHGPRRMMIIISALLGCACIAFGAAEGIVGLSLGFASLRFLAQGSLVLCCISLVSQWFDKKLGIAMSLMGLGFSLSMAVHPLLSQWLIDSMGWRQSWVALGVVTWVLLIIPVLILSVNRPEDIGLKPDGVNRTTIIDCNQQDIVAESLTGLTLKQALRTPAFYILSSGMGLFSMLVTSLHFFQVSIFINQGLNTQIAASAFLISAITMVIHMPLVGKLMDRVPTEKMFSVGHIVMAAALISMSFVNDLETAVLYAIIFGLNNAIVMTFYSYIYARYFGRKHLGSVQGTGQMIAIIGASLGPLPLALALDLFGSFQPMLWALAVLPIIWAFVALFLRAPEIPITSGSEPEYKVNRCVTSAHMVPTSRFT